MSYCKQDVLIGIELLIKTEFTYKDYIYNFPNTYDSRKSFERPDLGDEWFWVDLGHTFMGVSESIYCPTLEQEKVERWREVFSKEEIKL